MYAIATVRTQIDAANETWMTTSHQGSAFRYWISPTAICTSSIGEEDDAEPHDSWKLGPSAPEEHADDEQPDAEDRGRPHVDVDRVRHLQAETPDVLLRRSEARMRSRPCR